MRLATIRRGHDTTAAVRIDSDVDSGSGSSGIAARATATVIDGYADLLDLLADADWRNAAANASGQVVEVGLADYAPVVPRPGKIVCVGLNYATHIAEMGREPPRFPTLFTKFAEALTGPYDDVVVPNYAAAQLDWEGELAVVIGKRAYQVSESDAAGYIAGYAVINDYTMRDYQARTLQWDQGKTFEKTAGFGPFLVTDYILGSSLQTRLDGELMQDARTDDLVFTPTKLVEYISHIMTLQPGDVISTGTPGGVGHARKPQRYIQHNETVEITIDGIGTIRNTTIVH